VPKPNDFTLRVSQPSEPLPKRRTAWEIILLDDCLDPPRPPPRLTEPLLVGLSDPRILGVDFAATSGIVNVMLRPTVTNSATVVAIDFFRGTVTGEAPERFLHRIPPWPRNRHERKLRMAIGSERFNQLVRKAQRKVDSVDDPSGWNDRFWASISHPKVPQHRKGRKQRRPGA
jgi:hypothetical protein